MAGRALAGATGEMGAGEMMAGNVLGKGYTAGVGMSIGTAFGRIAGENLVAPMAGETRVRVTGIPAELIVRGSTAPPSSKSGCSVLICNANGG